VTERLATAQGILAAEPEITPAALARRLAPCTRRTAARILDQLRATGDAPLPVVAADGRRLTRPPRGPQTRVVRLPAALLERLARLPGAGPLEQIAAALDLIDNTAPPRGES